MELIKMDEDTVKPEVYYITKANDLVEARYRLSLTEQRIILLMASMVQPADEDFKSYRLYVKDFMNILDINRSHLYTQMVVMIRNLMERVISIRIGDDKYMDIHWIDKQVYGTGLGYIDITFTPELKPFFLHLKERFTTYRLENVMQLKSIYSIRIYELLKQYQGPGKRTITIGDLRKILGIKPEEYKLYGDFKRKVLLVAHREINEKTDISFTFKEIKLVRKVNELEFTIKKKSQGGAGRPRKEKDPEKAAEEKKKTVHRKKVESYLKQLTPEELEALTREAEELARAEGDKMFTNRKIPEALVRGYLFELAEKKLELKRK